MLRGNSIGDNLNEWRYPVCTFGSQETQLQEKIRQHDKLRDIAVDTGKWDLHCDTVNTVLSVLLDELKTFANKEFPGLIIHHYVRQGSSRDGLKVHDALEFDCLLVFEINGMEVEKCSVFNHHNGRIIPDLIKLRVNDYNRYDWLEKLNILEKGSGHDWYFYINTRNLHERVFKSLVDRTRASIDDKLPNNRNTYSIRRVVNPPTLAVQITVCKDISDINHVFGGLKLQNSNAIPEAKRVNEPTLDIDLVPALLLRQDNVPDPYTSQHYFTEDMRCPVYAVMKWAHNPREIESTIDHDRLWCESSCTYEKQILDIARRSESQRYLMTACRIVKSYATWLKINRPYNSQFHKVAVSYYLKNICFYCIVLLTIPSNRKSLTGVKEALGYFLQFFDLCIENRNLPHFFFANPWISAMFPNCSFGNDEIQKNLYCNIHLNTFEHTEREFRMMLGDLDGLYMDFNYLDQDRIGPFKELLGIRHVYKKPKFSHRKCSCTFWFIILAGLFFIIAYCVGERVEMLWK